MTTPPVARYQQVADRLRDAIVAGDYPPGQALPSESVLAEQYGLNRTTINKAVRLLAAQGLVTVEHGRGAFVRIPRPVMHVSTSYVTQVVANLARRGTRRPSASACEAPRNSPT